MSDLKEGIYWGKPLYNSEIWEVIGIYEDEEGTPHASMIGTDEEISLSFFSEVYGPLRWPRNGVETVRLSTPDVRSQAVVGEVV